MDKTATLEEELKRVKQQCLAYEQQAVTHGQKIDRLQNSLQSEESRASQLDSQVSTLWQHLQQEQAKNTTRCPRQASECEKVHKQMDKREASKAEKQRHEELQREKKKVKTLEDEKKTLSEKLRERIQTDKKKNEELESLRKAAKDLQDKNNELFEKQRKTSEAEKQKSEELERLKKSSQTCQDELSEKLRNVLESPECQRPHCRQLEQKIREQQKAIQMVSPMSDMARQYDGQHDQLKREYEELMTNPDGILGQLEKEFDDPFDAKVVLGEIFMAAYEESKKYMIEFVAENVEELFKVQTDQDEETGGSSDIDMDDLSRAFGLLLHSTAARSRLTHSAVIPSISGKIKRKIPKLEPCKRTKKKLPVLPLDKVVELTWKFVTLPNPIIVCQPKTFSQDIHSKEFEHWNPKLKQPYHLIYAKPVVYRSYHGLVACKGLVGNECGTPV